MKIERFEDLDCWKSARELMSQVYNILRKQELSGEFELKCQLFRAGTSVMNNIAEGFGRYRNKDFVRFLNIAYASSTELRSMTYILIDQEYVTPIEQTEIQGQIETTQKLVAGMIRYLNKARKIKESS